MTTVKTTKSGGAIVPAFSFAPSADAAARAGAEHFEIGGATFAAYYDPAHKLIFVIDTTADPSRKWDDILSNDYGMDLETVRPRKNNKYQKLDIEYAGLAAYNRLINAHASGNSDELSAALAELDEFRNAAALRSANLRLNAAREEMRTASETLTAATASIGKERIQIKKYRDKVAKLRADVGKKPTKESAAKILRAESRMDAANEKLKRTDARVKRARRRLRDARANMAAAERQLAALSPTRSDQPAPTPAPAPVKKNHAVVTPAKAGTLVVESTDSVAKKTTKEEKPVKTAAAAPATTTVIEASESEPVRDTATTSAATAAIAAAPLQSRTTVTEQRTAVVEQPAAPPEPETSEPENVTPPVPDVAPAPEIMLKVPNPKASEMSEEVKPLFTADPKVIDDGIAFKPIEFGASPQRPAPGDKPVGPMAVDFTPPTFGQSAPDTLNAATLSAVPPIASVEPVAPVAPVTNNAPPLTRPTPLMTAAESDAAALPSQSSASASYAALERPESPVGAEEIPIQIERKRPSAIYYMMLAILIALSVMTLWLYQHRMSDTVPSLKAAAPAAASAAPQNQVINDNPNAYAANGNAAAPSAPTQPAASDDGNPFLDNGPADNAAAAAPSDGGITLPLAAGAARALAAAIPVPAAPQPSGNENAAADDTIALPLQKQTGTAVSPASAATPMPASPAGSALSGTGAPAATANVPAAVMCPGTQIPADADGCCPGETLTRLGGTAYCCPAAGGNCYPPLTAATTATAPAPTPVPIAAAAASANIQADVPAAMKATLAAAPMANQAAAANAADMPDNAATEVCPDTMVPPNADGCCAGETLTDMGDQGMNCCDTDKGECFPPMK